MKPLKTIPATPEVVAFVDDLKAAIGKHQHLAPVEMLAGVSQLAGMIVALLDHTKITADEAMRIIEANIEAGNEAAIKIALPASGRN